MISVNGAEIAETAVLAEMQYHPATSREEAFTEAAEALVVRELLLQRAAAAGLTWASGDLVGEDAAIDALLKSELKLPAPAAADYRRYYDNNPSKFRTPDLFEAAHILYLAPRDDGDARVRAKAAAERALALLKTCPERFADIAKAESRCSSAGEGGRLGQIASGETTPEIDSFLQVLDVGQLCPVPVETDYGFHVLRVDRRIEGRSIPFADAAPVIERELGAHAWRRAVSQYVELLAGQADVQGIEIKKATSPLVQ